MIKFIKNEDKESQNLKNIKYYDNLAGLADTIVKDNISKHPRLRRSSVKFVPSKENDAFGWSNTFDVLLDVGDKKILIGVCAGDE